MWGSCWSEDLKKSRIGVASKDIRPWFVVPAQYSIPSDPLVTGLMGTVVVGRPGTLGPGRGGSSGVGEGVTISIVESAGPGEVEKPHGPSNP